MLQDKAMIANLTVRAWSARKRDRDVGKEVEKNHAATDAGNFNKLLIDKDALKPLVSLSGALRTKHYDMTMPWGDNGDRLLPSKMYFDYVKAMRDLRDQFTVAVNDFVSQYPTFKQNARKRLGTMYDPEDYPDVAQIKKKFGAELSFLPVPEAKDFRVDLGEDEVTEIRATITKEVASRYEEATRDLWFRITDAVSRVRDRLQDPDGVFRDSLVENVQAVCAIATKLNIDDDPNLDAICKDIEHRLCRIAPQRLRDDKVLRKTVYESACDIMKKLPTRK